MTLNVTSCRRKRQIDESVKSAQMRKDPVKEARKERKGKGPRAGKRRGGQNVANPRNVLKKIVTKSRGN